MTGGLAYHAVVHAMRGSAGLDARQRFAASLKSTIAGHMPYGQYREAASARRKLGANDLMVSRSVLDWLQTDLNPAIQTLRLVPNIAAAVGGYNAYNECVSLAVKTTADSGERSLVRRELSSVHRDDDLCRAGSMAVVEWIFTEVTRRGSRMELAAPRSSGECARYLGAERFAAAQAMQVLDSSGDHSAPELARSLGVGIRTLERTLAEDGLTPRILRMASRMNRVMGHLHGDTPLALIATEVGFSDQAHMSRSFKTACGMSPSLLRAIIRAQI
jgi:AraC-like DNA-binding protein